MEYIIKMHTVVETPEYLSHARRLFAEEEMAEIINTVAQDPECGDVMEGTGGFRKFRVGRGNQGKRGGARVVYIYLNDHFPIFLITVFAKNQKANLSKSERNQLKQRADAIFTNYRR
jgi:hypothetical protein